MPNRVLRLPAVLERTGYSRSRLYARISDGLFPRPVSLGPRVAAWPEHEVDAVIAAHIRAVTDTELVQLVADIHRRRPTFGLGAGAGALVDGTPGSPAA
ncbi:AlpA family transcriptional regulator [Thiohalocapsa halophila]|uniref:AlpA family transcriptional regulator n=1 Tax=Thiohalocapsa halophila TaxID=69359 RepID=A0ABS1CQ85_9GAMM|nr:AlpA family transcriptional regulator [Thiohalocapsa halophila]MBK1633974.1 AlpA family transcriptional regulator [Thiohalocapsa halophila]